MDSAGNEALYHPSKILESDTVVDNSSVLDVCFDSTGRFGLSATGRFARLWNVESGMLIQTYADHGRDVTSVAAASKGDRLASCAGRTAYIWDIATSTCVTRYRRHDGVVNAADFGGREDALLLTGSYDKYVRIFDVRSRSSAPVQILKGARDSVSDVASCSTNEARVFAGSIDGTVRTFDVRQGHVLVDDLCAPVGALSVSHDRECVLASCLDDYMRLLDISTGELLATYEGHVNNTYKLGCAILHDDSVVICGSENGNICFWDLADYGSSPRFGMTSSASPVSAVAAHPSRSVILSGSHDGSLLVWDITMGSSRSDLDDNGRSLLP
jgi:mitogen-activated protein kinase organizer 1